MSLEKEFEVEIGDKTYKIEMDNMGYLRFERLVGMGAVDWSLRSQSTGGQPKYEDMLKLLICALRKHHPKLALTVEKLTPKIPIKSMFINLGKESLGDKLVEALQSTFADEDDIKSMESESLEDAETDPLDEQPQDGQT